jgi:hypothetical protein
MENLWLISRTGRSRQVRVGYCPKPLTSCHKSARSSGVFQLPSSLDCAFVVYLPSYLQLGR